MKILTIVKDLNKGGTQRVAQNFCEGYKNLGHSSRLYAINGEGFRKDELELEGVHIYTNYCKETITDIKAWSPELIHVHSLDIDSKLVFELKELLPESKFVETNVFSTLTEYTSVLDHSFQLSKWCSYLYASRGGSREKLKIIPNPVKTQCFYKSSIKEIAAFKKKYRIPENTFVFGRIGQSYAGKWSLYLIDLFKNFLFEVSSNICLLLVNPPETLVDYAFSMPDVAERVVIIDKITGDDNLRSCYSSMDLFIHIARQGESFGMVLTESILCETPVVTLNTPWADNSQKEVIKHKVNGFCANSINEFFSYMKDFYNKTLQLEDLSSLGRKLIIDKYDYTIVAEKAIKALDDEAIYRTDFAEILEGNYKNEADRLLLTLLLLVKYKIKKTDRAVSYILKRRFKVAYR
ncbi:MAG: glycosyltransferase family 4 protein [Bacteroidota bacterium]